MKKILIFLPFVVLFLFSCASSPEPKDDGKLYGAPIDIGTAKERAVDARDKAKSIKADVAVKDDFSKALDVFNEAEANPTIEKYLEAETLFLASYESARVKKEEAQRQMNKARDDIRQVEVNAEAFEKEQKEGVQ
jgi:hypothetical protein